jgi:BlaR1 peptidase M56
MRPAVGLAILVLGGIAGACLLVGAGSSSICAAGMGSAACLGGSLGSIRDWFAAAAATGALLVGLLGVSILLHARSHQRLAKLLDGMALPDRLADQPVGLVSGLAAPCVAGLVDPRIYCPSDLAARLSESELRAVLLHERHHQLAHAPARLVVLAAVAPALGRLEAGSRWVERRRAAIEIEADAHALRAGASRPELAGALLTLGSPSLDAGLPSYQSASELRIRHLTGEASKDRSRLGGLAPMLLPITTFLACLLWHIA